MNELNGRNGSAVRQIQPLGYLDFLHLQKRAALVLTDSGGIQEETTILKVPCLTLRDSTERPITAEAGTNTVVGTDTERIVSTWRSALAGSGREAKTPPLWDGKAAQRIAEILCDKIQVGG